MKEKFRIHYILILVVLFIVHLSETRLQASDDLLSETSDEAEAPETPTAEADADDSLLGEDQSEVGSQAENQAEEKTEEQQQETINQADSEQNVDENLSSDEDDESASTAESTNPVQTQETQLVEVESNEGTVEVYSSIDLLKPYRDRREKTGWYLSAGVENFTPILYKSEIDSLFYDVLFFDDPIQMTTLTAYYKWNHRLGSIGVGYEYSQGSIYNADDDINLDVVRTGLGLMFAFDAIRAEPNYVPYFKIHLDKHDFIEDRPTTDETNSDITEIGYGYGIGLLIQMDQFDKETALNSYAEWGIENTFLDIALNWQNESSGADDQNFSTEPSDPGLSVGLRLEF